MISVPDSFVQRAALDFQLLLIKGRHGLAYPALRVCYGGRLRSSGSGICLAFLFYGKKTDWFRTRNTSVCHFLLGVTAGVFLFHIFFFLF